MEQVELVEKSSSLPVALHPGAAKKSSTDLVELATEIDKADSFVRATASNKLQAILAQIRLLQEQAAEVLRETNINIGLHHAACNFKKVPGNIYHLYEKATGQQYFSMLSPEEWGISLTDNFLGSYRLETDMSWTPASKIIDRENEMLLVDKILKSSPRISALPSNEDR